MVYVDERSRANIARQSLLEFANERLTSLLRALNVESDATAFRRVLARLAHPWGHAAIGHQPRYRSNISDDEFPVEFSVGFSNGSREVQFYVEPRGEPPNVISNMHAGKRLLAALAGEPGICLDRLRLIEDLFFPEVPQPPATKHARHLYCVLVTDEAPVTRDEFMLALHRLGIGTGVHYRAVHTHTYYRNRFGFVPAYEVTLWSMCVATILLGPFAKEAADALLHAPKEVAAAVVYLGVFPSAVAHLSWTFVLAHMPAAKATSLLMLVSPVAVLIGGLWLGESLSMLAWAGGALAFLGVALVQRANRSSGVATVPPQDGRLILAAGVATRAPTGRHSRESNTRRAKP